MPKSKKKQKKTENNRYPHEHRGFSPGMYSATVRWQIMDAQKLYPKLSYEERCWMSQFLLEYHNGAVKKNDPNAIFKSDEDRKDCYNRKNAANRDLFSILNANGKIESIDAPDDSRTVLFPFKKAE